LPFPVTAPAMATSARPKPSRARAPPSASGSACPLSLADSMPWTLPGHGAHVVREIDQNRTDSVPNHSQPGPVDRPATNPSPGGPMPQPARSRSSFPKPIAILLGLIVIALLAGGPAQAATSKRVVKKAANSRLGKTILVNLRGLTLYSLSAETNGKFICKRGCLIDWHPLYVAKGIKPTGSAKLGTVKRPDN